MPERRARAGRVAACPILLYTLDCPKLINWQALWCVFIMQWLAMFNRNIGMDTPVKETPHRDHKVLSSAMH